MSNLELYNNAFMDTLQLDESSLNDDLVYQSVETWDSVGHMMLMSALEDAFDIMLETDDILVFESYPKGKEILSKNYGVEF